MPLTRRQLAAAILPLAEEAPDNKKLAKAIAQHLVRNRQTKDLDVIIRDMVALRIGEGVVEATVTSAFPLSAGLKKDITEIISESHRAQKVVINEVIDPSVIGGLRIETSEKQLDMTVRAKLRKLQQITT